LLIEVSAPVSVCVGRLGTFAFPAGLYCYTGSARRNLEARRRRHLSAYKTLRWHIDYLLAAAGVRIREVRRDTEAECLLNQRTPGIVPVPGFGASDCHAGCGSHLKRLG
jgi:Uri superfamily endonuclease